MTSVRPEAASAESARSESIEELFARLESPLLSYALRLLGERARAEDIVQEAFMKLHVHFGEVREPRQWLYRTVHNLALNCRRESDKVVSLAASEQEESHETPDPKRQPDEQSAHSEGIGLVRLTLVGLDDRSREVVRLKFDEDLSYKEISEQTGLTVSHVGYLLHHALKAIAAELTRIGLAP